MADESVVQKGVPVIVKPIGPPDADGWTPVEVWLKDYPEEGALRTKIKEVGNTERRSNG